MARKQQMNSGRTREGDELTPELLDQLAAEAEAGFEHWEGGMVVAGRPPLSISGPSRRLQARVAPELGERLDALAGERDTTVSEIVREALERYLSDAA